MVNIPSDKQLSSSELYSVLHDKAIENDYFYIPVIAYKEDGLYHEDWYTIHYNNEDLPFSVIAYTNKVPAGVALSRAVKNDLVKDFKYPDAKFSIDDIKTFGVARNSDGDTLTRVVVHVLVEKKFDITDVHPLGMDLSWSFEDDSEVSNDWDSVLVGSNVNGSLRDEVVAAYRPFVKRGAKSPRDIKVSNSEAERAIRLEFLYHEVMKLIKEPLSLDDRIELDIEELTVLFGAGFTDLSLLDDIAHNGLAKVKEDAKSIGRQDLEDKVQGVINNIEYKIQEVKAVDDQA